MARELNDVRGGASGRAAQRLVAVERREQPTDRPGRLKALLSELVDLAAEVAADRGHSTQARLDAPLLTPDEAAALLAIPRSTLLDLAARGRLPCLRFGKHVRFDRGALAAAGRQDG